MSTGYSLPLTLLSSLCYTYAILSFQPLQMYKVKSFRHLSPSYSSCLLSTSQSLEFDVKSTISSISPQVWNSCVNADEENSSPFLEHSWLASLEESGCASISTGWMPSHIEIKMNDIPCAYVPLYIKNNSMGEFIFDAEWAQYAVKNDIKYYPKILCGIPFTPVACSKILMSPGFRYQLSSSSVSNDNVVIDNSGNGIESNGAVAEFRAIVAKVIKDIATSNNLSSVHINFLTDEEALHIAGPLPVPTFNSNEEIDDSDQEKNTNKTNGGLKKVKSVLDRIAQREKNDFFRRTSLQYHWQNRNYTSFQDYLSCFKSKKRITINRERRRVLKDQNIRIDAIKGRDILSYPGLVERMFEIYKSTVDKMFFGNQYLTLEFFEKLVNTDFIDNMLFMCARYNNTDTEESFEAKDVFAGTFNVIKNKVFYGRYWGCLPNFDVKNLHFEVCYWSAIEYCINNKLKRFEPGAGGGDYKWARGFDPILIHSCHYISQPSFRKAVKDYVQFDSERNIAISQLLNERSAVVKQNVLNEDDVGG